MNSTIAALTDPGSVWVLIPVIAIVGGIGLGLISTLLNHQKSMTKIVRGQTDDDTKSEIAALRQEIYELKGMLHQALQGGSVSARITPPEPVAPSLRVTSGE